MTQENEKEQFIIAIDGTSGSGKSSTARHVAQVLELAYVDTGAMYRAVTYYCQKQGIPHTDQKAVVELTESLKFSLEQGSLLHVNRKPLGDEIRTPEVDLQVSDYCAIPAVREILVKVQRDLGNSQPSVVDGRDITSVVFKDAKYKYYFYASPEARAKRRMVQLENMGIEADYNSILENLKSRDSKDTTRKNSPLTRTEDANFIDTTNMTLAQQTDIIIQQVQGGTAAVNSSIHP